MKTLDIRVVVDDEVYAQDCVNAIAGSTIRENQIFLGAQMLENDGFGHSLATGPHAVYTQFAGAREIEEKFEHPDTNWKGEA